MSSVLSTPNGQFRKIPKLIKELEGFKSLKWWPEVESNHRHEDFQSSALPTELSGLSSFVLLAGERGLDDICNFSLVWEPQRAGIKPKGAGVVKTHVLSVVFGCCRDESFGMIDLFSREKSVSLLIQVFPCFLVHHVEVLFVD